MSEEMGLPQTYDVPYMKPGIHKVHIVKIEPHKDKDGNLKNDDRGYPGFDIYFQNTEGEMISSTFYYSTLPQDHPDRNNPARKCMSEWRLKNLKAAMGFGTESVPMSVLTKKWIWLAVGLQPKEPDQNGNAVLKYTQDNKPYYEGFSTVLSKFWSGDIEKPLVAGNPELDKENHLPSDIFLVKSKPKFDKSGAGSAAGSVSSALPTAKEVDSAATGTADMPDMPRDVDDF